MSKESLPAGTLNTNEERRILRGHQWLYRNEFKHLPELEDGAVLDIFASNRRFIARAFYQASGGIAARALTRHQTPIDAAFFQKRLETALRLRSRLFPDSTVYRWIHGESDGLPGLVVDRYDTVAAVQTNCAFYLRQWDVLATQLRRFAGVETVLTPGANPTDADTAALPELALSLDGLRLHLSFEKAQKTGLFLDQRENWPLIRRFAPGATVLDGYCHHGLWGCHAALAGASEVLGVDSSEDAVAHANANAEMNQLSPTCRFVKGRVESILEEERTFDVIVLDPPAFAKTRGQARKALSLYEDLNARALRRLNTDGILITCSCSHFLDRGMFMEAIKRAARSVSRTVQALDTRGAAADHPVLPAMPETEYLECFVLRAL